jgi:hypothetical protein
MRHELKKEHDLKLEKKADLIYVKDLEVEVKGSISRLESGNSTQHKQLFDKVNAVAQGVARIEGYMAAQKDK